ncbi:Hypothetical predicted protein, partial [Pelobates cultripes]
MDSGTLGPCFKGLCSPYPLPRRTLITPPEFCHLRNKGQRVHRTHVHHNSSLQDPSLQFPQNTGTRTSSHQKVLQAAKDQ